MNNIIVGMGEALWDVLPEGKKIGGAPANFAYHVSQFGFDSRVVSEKKLNTQIERVDYPTGTVQVTLDAEGVPCYEIKEGVAWDNIPFTDEMKRLALNTRAVCFGSLAQRNEASRATINRFLDTMPEIDGQLKIFDINLRQDFYTKEVLRDSFQRCNVLKINDEELVTISRMFGYPGIDLQDKCWILLAKYNLKMLILTCGINGSYVFTPGCFLPGDSESPRGRYGRCRRFLYGCLLCFHIEWKAGARSTQTGCGSLCLRLYAERGDAGTAAGVERQTIIILFYILAD